MKKTPILYVILIMLTVLALTTIAADGGRKYTTTMTGAAEVPGPGDPDGSGTATIRLNPGQGEVCFEIEVSGVAPITLAHIHEAPVGVQGGPVVTLTTTGELSGCVENVSQEEIMEIIQHPEEYYVNVHNADFPGGALRGQLSK